MDRMNYDGPNYGCVGVTVGVRLGSDLREWRGGYTTMQDHIVWLPQRSIEAAPENLRKNLTWGAIRPRGGLERVDKGRGPQSSRSPHSVGRGEGHSSDWIDAGRNP